MKSLIERIRTLADLTPRERHLLLYAWLLFLLVDPALRLFPVMTLLPAGRAPGPSGREPGAPGSSPSVDRIGWLVMVAARYARRRATCLEQSLVLAWLLRREGLEANVRIGVARQARGLQAHAWVEQGGRVIGGSADGAIYEPLLSTTAAVGST